MWAARTTMPTRGSLRPRLATNRSGKRDRERHRDDHERRHRDDEPRDLRPHVVAVRVSEDSGQRPPRRETAKSPAVAPTARSASHEEASTWRATPSDERPTRVSGTDVTRPSDDAVAATTAVAIRYA